VLEIVPTAGLTDHVTAVFDDPLTVAVNWLAWETVSDAVEGVTDTLTGAARATLTLADFVGSAALVALTVTDCALAIEPGEV
jgi:hypothetical protein